MLSTSIFDFFIPKDKKFFPLFEQMSLFLVEMAALLDEMVNNPDPKSRAEISNKLEDLEHQCDEITHQIHLELSKNFITPFDREDIHALATSLDDVADFINGTSTRLTLYKVDPIIKPIKDISALLREGVEHLKTAIFELKELKNVRRITDTCIRINSIENKTDYIFEKAVADLFEFEKNAITLIKYKEVLAYIENATDKCEDVVNVIESILVKKA